MTNTKKIVLLSLLAIVLLGVTSYSYIMYGGARDLASEETAYVVNSTSIIEEFTKNIDVSNTKYLEKPIAISGTITAINGRQIIIDHSIICNLKNPDISIKEKQKVIIKGRVIGYDDLMLELKLDQCFIVNN
ncbi:OB-fold protein [Flavobacterium sp. TSSA_36]|uniref:OB-fold protein n=1 Tax=Flavobacterium sp. TSSA_36 TaxID=3447669 RepID=UPI003F2CF88B